MDRILVPADGTDAAEEVLPFAASLAGPNDGELVILRVLQPLPSAARLAIVEPGVADAMFLDEMEARRHLAALTERLTGKGLRVRAFLRLGAPASEILRVAESEAVDVIAMATHVRRGLDRIMLGSVVEEVLRAAPIPVVMVRMAAKRTASAVAAR